jgi:hypothetical protein
MEWRVLPLICLTLVHNGVVGTCGETAEPTGHIPEQTKKVLERSGLVPRKGRHEEIEARGRASMAGAL